MIASLYHIAAIATGLLSASVFYIGCPNQQWLSRPLLSFRTASLLALLLAAAAWWLLRINLSPLAASFTLCCLLMLSLGLLPFFSRLPRPNSAKQKKMLEKDRNHFHYHNHWLAKSLIAAIPGFLLAVGSAGLITWWGPGTITHDTKTQLVMWLITPIWLTLTSLIFFVRSGQRAALGFAAAILIVYSLLWIARSGM